MLRDGKVQLGEYNLSVTADSPPPAYSQLSSDVALPNLKWIDGHKPIFKVNLSMVSSIHPQVSQTSTCRDSWCSTFRCQLLQDDHLLNFMKAFYDYNPRLGAEMEEKTLAGSMLDLKRANAEPLVQFLHITLNNLGTLLVRPSVTEESAKVCGNAFEALAHIVHTVQELDLPTDKHDRNEILASYLQYVFNAPLGQHSAGAFDARTATLTKTRTSSMGADDDYSSMANKFKGGSVRGTKGVSFAGRCGCK